MENNNRREYLLGWGNILSFFAIVLSVIAILQSCQVEKRGSIPNMQTVKIDSSRSYELDRSSEAAKMDKIVIKGTVALRNFGSADCELVDLTWDPFIVGDSNACQDLWLAISDRNVPSELSNNFFFDRRYTPILGIADPIFVSGQTRTLNFQFSGFLKLNDGQEIPNIRMKLVFSNGQELILLPFIKHSGVGAKL